MDIKQTPAAIEYQKEVTEGITKLMKTVTEHKQKVENYESDSSNTQLEDLPGEIWKDIEGFEGIYQISNKGRIKSLKYWYGRNKLWLYRVKILKPNLTRKGYYITHLRNASQNQNKHVSIHRLVAKHFLPIPDELLKLGYNIDTLEINHKDEIKTNNHVENLEWCTRHYNINYGTAIKRIVEQTQRPVTQFDEQGHFIANYTSAKEASEHTGIHRSHITHSANHNLNSAGGYLWEYTKKEYKVGYQLPLDKIRKIRDFTTPVAQFDENGMFLNKYNSVIEAAKTINLNHSSISVCLCDYKHRHKSAGGFIWKYWKPEYCKGYKLPDDEIPKINLNNKDSAKLITIYDLDGNIVELCNSIQEASTFLKISRSCVRKILKRGGIYKNIFRLEWVEK